ncbi:MAG: NTP transferase domain-containing protein, partial [Duncaniella sp.]|nr:NTP transferase domain-containing protein [Duncaniella sp.]
MVYAVIAAGQGSRLASEGICLPKPLVDVGGEPLIGRMVRLMARQPDCERIEIVVNSHSREVEVYLASLAGEFP